MKTNTGLFKRLKRFLVKIPERTRAWLICLPFDMVSDFLHVRGNNHLVMRSCEPTVVFGLFQIYRQGVLVGLLDGTRVSHIQQRHEKSNFQHQT